LEIHKGIEIVDLGLFIKEYEILIVCDLHIGLEEAMIKEGYFVPRFQFDVLIERLRRLVRKVRPKIVVINGDIKHKFGGISDQEWRDCLKIIDFLQEKCKVVLVRGNHDKILGPIAKKRNLEIVDYYKIKDIMILHGHKVLPNLSKVLIIGHDHIAISLRDGIKTEKYKCFLKGKYFDKELIVMPSFNFVSEGTDILKGDLLSPFLKQDLGKFRIFIVFSDKVYDFGYVKDLEN